ncbi:hypothetical protein JN25_02955 [Bacillus sp. BSC154]|nr:hypothetical protein JN25_02955 [Bacillus sp. BSC154]
MYFVEQLWLVSLLATCTLMALIKHATSLGKNIKALKKHVKLLVTGKIKEHSFDCALIFY